MKRVLDGFVNSGGKVVVLSLLVTFLNNALQAQNPFTYSAEGKIAYVAVVQQSGHSAHQLYVKALSFVEQLVKRKKKDIDLPKEGDELIARAQFLILKKGFGHQPLGEVRYQLTLEVKSGRYRYVMTDFVFHPYERNRYGKFERISGKGQTLEALAAFKNKNWDQYCHQIDALAQGTLLDLRAFMLRANRGEEFKSQKSSVDINEDW